MDDYFGWQALPPPVSTSFTSHVFLSPNITNVKSVSDESRHMSFEPYDQTSYVLI
jgi:hypothetical protein